MLTLMKDTKKAPYYRLSSAPIIRDRGAFRLVYVRGPFKMVKLIDRIHVLTGT